MYGIVTVCWFIGLMFDTRYLRIRSYDSRATMLNRKWNICYLYMPVYQPPMSIKVDWQPLFMETSLDNFSDRAIRSALQRTNEPG